MKMIEVTTVNYEGGIRKENRVAIALEDISSVRENYLETLVKKAEYKEVYINFFWFFTKKEAFKISSAVYDRKPYGSSIFLKSPVSIYAVENYKEVLGLIKNAKA